MPEYGWTKLEDGREVFRRLDVGRPAARSDLPTPYLASDTMDPVQHPCTGEYLTSKSAFRSITKAHGCVEVGNDPARLRPKPKPKPDRAAIRKSLKKAAEIVASR
jgi:hypothetical protein